MVDNKKTFFNASFNLQTQLIYLVGLKFNSSPGKATQSLFIFFYMIKVTRLESLYHTTSIQTYFFKFIVLTKAAMNSENYSEYKYKIYLIKNKTKTYTLFFNIFSINSLKTGGKKGCPFSVVSFTASFKLHQE